MEIKSEAIEQLRQAVKAIEQELDVTAKPKQGHDEPCYYCNKPCNIFAGDPSLWPVALPHREEPGVVKWHHSGCVLARLEQLDRPKRMGLTGHTINKRRLFQLLKGKSLELAKPGELFHLASGKTSSYYLDVRKTALSPEGHFILGELLCMEIEWKFPNTQAVVGVALGGCPLASATSLTSYKRGLDVPALYVRKELKTHGTKNLIEGEFFPGMKVMVLEDVTTSGESALNAVTNLCDAGLDVLGVITVVDREDGARETFAHAGLAFHSLFTISDILC